jgi:ribosomal protein S18 acetylase RimI-like enzyme
MEECIIRKGETSDSVRLADLTARFFPYLHLSADAIFDRMKNGVQYLVLEKKGTLEGFVDYEFTREPNPRHATLEHDPLKTNKAAKIMGLCVNQELQGRGWGKKLFTAALDEVSRYSNHVVVLVESSNQKAISLYEQFGFQQHGRLSKPIFNRDILLFVKKM